jgi:hypothetical protein
MDETYVLDLEVSLSLFPFFRPSQVGFVELLPQFRDFNRIGRWKEKFVSHRLTHHYAISLSRTIHRVGLTVGTLKFSNTVRALHFKNRIPPGPLQPKREKDSKKNHPTLVQIFN